MQSPDGKSLAFSALAHIYVMPLDRPRHAAPADAGRTRRVPAKLVTGRPLDHLRALDRARCGTGVAVAADGIGAPVQVTSVPAYYTNPVYTPDGRSIVAIRSSNVVRMHRYMEYGPLRDAELC